MCGLFFHLFSFFKIMLSWSLRLCRLTTEDVLRRSVNEDRYPRTLWSNQWKDFLFENNLTVKTFLKRKQGLAEKFNIWLFWASNEYLYLKLYIWIYSNIFVIYIICYILYIYYILYILYIIYVIYYIYYISYIYYILHLIYYILNII